MSTVIKVENLSKQYRLGVIGAGTLRDDVQRWWHRVRGKEDPLAQVSHGSIGDHKLEGRDLWALRDISFDVKQGEVLGIIGRNGAGKSTLLKILSRVTGPTSGRIKIKGRMASLLEVGTGFHPELTGRENIFLNGAILGMSREEVGRKLDQIIDFAEIEQFIDTPVKRYSSGMYVRLAFSVAAHLDPEILVIDEVLAVGDLSFQRKCLGKMGDSSREGKTILFVSHNMDAVSQLCARGVVLERGCIVCDDIADRSVQLYLNNSRKLIHDEYHHSSRLKRENSKLIISGFRQSISGHNQAESFASFLVSIDSKIDHPRVGMSIAVASIEGVIVGSSFGQSTISVSKNEKSTHEIIYSTASLAPGSYYVSIAVFTLGDDGSMNICDDLTNALVFDVISVSRELSSGILWSKSWGNTVFPPLIIKSISK